MIEPRAGTQVLIIGVGNAIRGDDGVGLAAARCLKGIVPQGVEVLEMTGDGVAIMDAWCAADLVLVLDAVVSGARPGTVHRFDAGKEPIPSGLTLHSSHLFGVAEAVELARTLGALPGRLVIIGIEGQTFQPGVGMTSQVLAATRDVVALALEEIKGAV